MTGFLLSSPSRGLVSVGNCVPFPYVSTALSGGLALLELIQTVGKTTDDLKHLAESVVIIIQDSIKHLAVLSKDIGIMSKDWSSSKFKKYLKANSIRDEIAQFTLRVADLRADATLMAAVGTRMDLGDVANTVNAVQSSVSEIQNELAALRSGISTATTDVDGELVRSEQDFHALKLGDIELEFETARTTTFFDHHEMFDWTDYKGNPCEQYEFIRDYMPLK
ncbi:hypothetical protein FB451DRAFT_1553634 [Mycena latifolia]|nr:hypothetical protein FB451DRAFT_1553634 [Mycena latifolia]